MIYGLSPESGLLTADEAAPKLDREEVSQHSSLADGQAGADVA